MVEKAISHGTVRMRTFVEIDPRAAFRSFEAIKRIKADYAFAIDIEICAFAQEGLTNESATFRCWMRRLQMVPISSGAAPIPTGTRSGTSNDLRTGAET